MGGAAIFSQVMRGKAQFEEALQDLENARENGIDRDIWNIYGSDTDFPVYDRNPLEWLVTRKGEYKRSSESPGHYVKRLVRDGRNIQRDGHIYVVKGSLALEFTLQHERNETRQEMVYFFDADQDAPLGGGPIEVHDVKDIVEVRYRHFRLDYQGCKQRKDLPFDPTFVLDEDTTTPYKIKFQ